MVAAALELFQTKGYHSTKVSDIVKAAGIAQGTFYLYFKSKEDLFRKAAEECMDEIAGALDQEPTGSADLDGPTVMYGMIKASLTVYYHNRKILHIISRHGEDSPELSEVCRNYYARLAQLIIRTFKHYNIFPHYTEEAT
ncbi:TetR/AcrR family transcriptional regulator [Paenibacillus sp. P26]|nr:TetR/AcrR family transcriptional regulator [Paenibacillus sp. P26]